MLLGITWLCNSLSLQFVKYSNQLLAKAITIRETFRARRLPAVDLLANCLAEVMELVLTVPTLQSHIDLCRASP